MKTAVLAAIIFGQLAAFAAPNYCHTQPMDDIKKVPVTLKASYFFRVFQNADKVSFASQDVNYILDLNTKALVKLPGTYDPVPLGEIVMSVPSKSDGMAYYSIPEILSGDASPKLLYRSVEMKGVYQSTGLIEKGDGYDIYGIIAAGAKEIQYQKIKVIHNPLRVEPASEILSLCRGIDIKMPMLSKNGQEMSGFDAAAGVSKIWKLNLENNSCHEVDNLGMFAAKADFSFDSKKLTFHLSANGNTYKLKSNGSGEIDWVESPTAEMSQSVFQYDRQTHSLTRVSFNPPGTNAYYPVYQRDGSILYAMSNPTKNEYSFELIRPHQIKNTKMALLNYRDFNRVNAILTIGKLWNMACTPHYSIKSPEALSLIALGLDKENCTNLIRDQWNPKRHLELIKSADIISRPESGLIYRRDLMSLMETRDLLNVCQQLQ